MSISSFFENTLGANLSNSRWSWGASNPSTNQLFLRVWSDQLELVDGVERILILAIDWKSKSQGRPERERHVQALRTGALGYGVLCTSKENHGPGKREIQSFDDASLLQFGEIIEEDGKTYATIIDRVSVKNLARRQTAASSLVPDLKSILTKNKDVTTKESMALARVGQGFFRKHVLAIWGSQCCVTRLTTLDAVRASHIKPWRDSNNEERLDPNNGLPLAATLDALFDAGLISFTDTGELLVSSRLEHADTQLLGLDALQMIREPNDKTTKYLAYHREHIFCKA